MSQPSGGGRDRGPGTALVRVGVVLTVAGMVATLVALLPLVVPSVELPSAFWWLSMSSGIGVILVVLGVRRMAVARGRRILLETAA